MVEDDLNLIKNISRIKDLINIKFKTEYEQPFKDFYSFNMSVLDGKCCFRNSNFKPYSNVAGKNSFLAMGDIGESIENISTIRYRGYHVPLWDKYNGMEDPKLIKWNGDLWCLFVRPNHQIRKICMGLLNLNNKKSYIIEDPEGRAFTKNWMPIVLKDKLFLVTDSDPFKVYEFKNEKMNLVYSSINKKYPFLIHGGSNLIDFKDKFIGIVHGRVEVSLKKYVYWHSFFSCNKDWSDMNIGKPFVFEDEQIEFCLSIDIENDLIKVPYSTNDESLKIIEFNVEELEKLL